MNREICKHDNDSFTCKYCEIELRFAKTQTLEQQLKQAHRQGWEQCQKAAIIKTMEHHQDFMFGSSIPTVCRDIADAIAAMEYKESTND